MHVGKKQNVLENPLYNGLPMADVDGEATATAGGGDGGVGGGEGGGRGDNDNNYTLIQKEGET